MLKKLTGKRTTIKILRKLKINKSQVTFKRWSKYHDVNY